MSEHCIFLSTQKWDFESAFIRRLSNCAWSHVGWFRGADRMTFSSMADGLGLNWRVLKKGQELLLVEAPGVEEALALALPYIGTPYDYLDILGMILGRNWSRPNHFICDVALLQFHELAGFPLVNPKWIPRIHMTPRDILLGLNVTADMAEVKQSCKFRQ